jgi:hypothetical protein
MEEGTKYENIAFAVMKAKLQEARNQPEMAGRAMKETVQTRSREIPFSHLPDRGLMICLKTNLCIFYLFSPV